MNYIILDLEWNQNMSKTPVFVGDTFKPFAGEIIQIGAFRLNDDFSIADSFDCVVKPIYYKTLHFKVKELTGISEKDLEHAEEFSKVCKKFREWCSDEAIFLTWGYDDIDILNQNLQMHGLDKSWTKRWYNIQVIYNNQTGTGSNQKALSTAIQYFNIVPEREFHNALNDAYYTSLICQKLDIKKGIEHCNYVKGKSREEGYKKSRFFGKFSGHKEILSSKQCSSELVCPVCNCFFAESHGYKRENPSRYYNIFSCKTDGDFFVKVAIARNRENDLYRVDIVVKKATPDSYEMYENAGRVFKNKEKQRAKTVDFEKTKSSDKN